MWWDPTRLDLDVDATFGLRQHELIGKDAPDGVVEQDLAAYHAWRAAREAALTSGARESLVVRTVREYALALGAHPSTGSGRPERAEGQRLAPEVALIEVARGSDRPAGPRFGTLVHAVLATVPIDAATDRIREVAVLQGRVLGADDEEVAAAAEIADRVLAHDLLARARSAAARHACRRESPVMMKDEAGTLIEGVVDLAFEEDGVWTVVDFKTDQEMEAELDLYRRQVSLYAEMVAAATGQSARAILMRI